MKGNRLPIFVLLIVLSAFTLAGCTSSNDNTLDEIEQRVELVNNDSEPILSGENSEISDVANESNVNEKIVEEAEVDPEDEVEAIVEEVNEDINEDDVYTSATSYDGAVTADNVRIVGYNYYWENNQLVYEWTFKSGNVAKQIASYEAGFNSDNDLVVKFTSLTSDYVAVDGETTTLGSRLPDLTTSRNGTVSGYTFEIGSENAFELKIVGDKLILKLDI